MEFFGITWVGMNPQNGHKLLLSLAFVVIVVVISRTLRWLVGIALRSTETTSVRTRFWTRQGISLVGAVILILGLLSIWFSDPTRLATALGLVSAGLAFALQQPVTSIAGYFVILRGATFNVGDRISMGGVRGDVLRLGFIQTTIMEMGQPPAVQASDPAIWVRSRQFTGRIVTVSNSKIFADPVYNYTRDFPSCGRRWWCRSPTRPTATRWRPSCWRRRGFMPDDPAQMATESKVEMERRFGVDPLDLDPKVYFRITDNWLELTVRFIVLTHRIRSTKDAMSRYIVDELDKADIGVASATYDIVGFPAVDVRRVADDVARS